jgi:small-conductance mechanosensitive channel
MIEETLRNFISSEFLDTKIFGNSLEQLIVAISIFCIFAVIFRIFRCVIIAKITEFAQKAPASFLKSLVAAFGKINASFYDLIALYLALSSLSLYDRFRVVLDAFLLGLVMLQIISSLQIIIEYYISKITSKEEVDGASLTATRGILLLVNIVLYAIAILLILSNLGIDISSLIASLGIGGIAVALAAQSILADIFSAFTIYFDKPFVVGDFIIVGDKLGTVEDIGIKTTRIAALHGEQIIIPNQELTKSTVHNYKKMPRRRVLFTIGVTYNTNLDKCKQVPKIIRSICEEFSEHLTLDRVNFLEFGDSSLRFEIVYYHGNKDFTDYMNYREKINLRIKEEFEKEGIVMAFPTRTLYMEKS